MTGDQATPFTENASTAVRELVSRHARVTPLLPAPVLSQRLGREVLLKLECLQVTGSFKVRGAAARLESLGAQERLGGVVACSSGNHGRAISYVAGRTGIPARVFVPDWVDPVKLDGIRSGGAEAILTGATFDEAEAAAIQAAEDAGSTYVSAYDDPWVINGQGTIGLEIADQLEGRPISAFLAPLSGGGLIAGVSGGLNETGLAPSIVAVSAERAAVMHESIEAGRPVELPEELTLANALAGGIGLDNRYSFDLIQQRVDQYLKVSEEEIADAIRFSLTHLNLVVEGGGAVALATLLNGSWTAPDTEGVVVVLLSGGNVATETLLTALGRE